eukprot:TRINITY_DN20094_c0_g3_i1.p2 TRINITY_DN20094_c0_g3~~TRINITY_DN20094_c0_g3_i1.p2  ORF type:complete len:136 (+),score=10.61 TRINITY_DN20094_c0_g3_i1:157-564(+)
MEPHVQRVCPADHLGYPSNGHRVRPADHLGFSSDRQPEPHVQEVHIVVSFGLALLRLSEKQPMEYMLSQHQAAWLPGLLLEVEARAAERGSDLYLRQLSQALHVPDELHLRRGIMPGQSLHGLEHRMQSTRPSRS